MMRTPFRRTTSPSQPGVDPLELEELLPASVRQPAEANRFTRRPSDPAGDPADGDAPDADLQFLESLASAVARGEAAPELSGRFTKPQVGAPAVKEATRNDEAALDLFRNTRIERDQQGRPNVTVAHIDMGDLLEDLTTVRAALRERRAA